MTEVLLDYLKELCVSHVDFNHSEDEENPNTAYYEFDYVGFQAERNRNNVVLYIHKIKGAWTQNKGDNKNDQMYLLVIFFKKVGMTSLSKTRANLLECKVYAEEFYEKMEADRMTHDDPDVCKVLRLATSQDWMYEQTELSNDGWIGLQVRIPITTAKNITENDPARWQ